MSQVLSDFLRVNERESSIAALQNDPKGQCAQMRRRVDHWKSVVQCKALDGDWVRSLATADLAVRRAHDLNAVDQSTVVLQLAVAQQ